MTAVNDQRISGRVPGEPGVWILIFGDLMVFGLFFGTFAWYHGQEPSVFRTSQAALDQGLGLLNTFILLTSSLFVASGIEAMRGGAPVVARRRSMLAAMLGCCFVAVKAFEYGSKIKAGIYPVTNDFFMLYFAFTGIHLVHVLVGIGVLFLMRVRMGLPATPSNLAIAEGCGLFWHLVDVLWVVLFAIFYMHR